MKITLVGAGGKMGLRLTRNLKDSEYEMAYVEIDESAEKKLKKMGITVSQKDKEIIDSDIL